MLPIRDHNPSLRVPYVNYALLAANILIFLSYLPLFGSERALYLFFVEWAVIPARIMVGEGAHTLITSMFLHGGWMHLLGNMLFLWVFGDNLEDRLGHLGYLGFYLVCGIGAALAQVATAPDSLVPMVGASGAIAGVMGGYMLLYPRARVDVLFVILIIPIRAWGVLGLWFGLQLVNGLNADASAGGVAYWAHAGGFVIGALLMLPVFLALGGPAYWRRFRGHPPHPEAQYRYVRTHVPKTRGRAAPLGRSAVPSIGRRRRR